MQLPLEYHPLFRRHAMPRRLAATPASRIPPRTTIDHTPTDARKPAIGTCATTRQQTNHLMRRDRPEPIDDWLHRVVVIVVAAVVVV